MRASANRQKVGLGTSSSCLFYCCSIALPVFWLMFELPSWTFLTTTAMFSADRLIRGQSRFLLSHVEQISSRWAAKRNIFCPVGATRQRNRLWKSHWTKITYWLFSVLEEYSYPWLVNVYFAFVYSTNVKVDEKDDVCKNESILLLMMTFLLILIVYKHFKYNKYIKINWVVGVKGPIGFKFDAAI